MRVSVHRARSARVGTTGTAGPRNELALVNFFDLTVRQAAIFGPGNLDCSTAAPQVSCKEADLR